MAVRGKPLDAATQRQIVRLSAVLSIRKTAKEADVDRNTARKYIRAEATGGRQ